MAYTGRAPSAAPLTSADINDGAVAPADLSTGAPSWTAGGAVTLPYNGSEKLATTSTGIDVTGTVTADGSVRLDSTTPLYRGVSSLSASGSTVGQVRFDATHTPSSTIYTGPSVEALKDDADYATGIKIKTTASSGSNLARFYAASNGDISFYEATGTTPKLVWKAADESLGIGTSNPTAKTQTNATSAGAATVGLFLNNESDTIDTEVRLAFAANANNDIASNRYSYISAINTSGSNGQALRFATNQTGASAVEAMRIDSSGRLMFNRTTTTGARVCIQETAAEAAIDINHTNSGTQYFQYMRYNGTAIGTIIGSNTSTSYNTTSDYRLKEDWQPMSGSIDRLKALNPVNFAWKVDGSRVDGFLAHEAAEVVPEAVTGEKDAVEAIGNVTDAEGTVVQENVTEPAELAEGQTWTKTEDRPVYQGIDQSKLVPLLTAALQEAVSKIEALETRIAALEV
jgi:hypothetical protein